MPKFSNNSNCPRLKKKFKTQLLHIKGMNTLKKTKKKKIRIHVQQNSLQIKITRARRNVALLLLQ